MKSQQHYPLKISTLCPVHIGCDEVYEPTNYVIEKIDDQSALFEFDTQSVIKALLPAQREQLNRLVNGKPNEAMIKGIQAFFYKNRHELLAYAKQFLPVAKGVAELYQSRIGKTAQIESGGKQVINKLEIQRTFYNPHTAQPIIPGSSIKGAIRTALLDSINQGKPLQKNRQGKSERNQELQKRLFNYRDMHQDPLRLIHIGDASYNPTQEIKQDSGKEVRFAVNRAKKIKHKNGRQLQSQAEEKGLYQLLECLNGMNPSAFELQLSLQTPQNIANLKAQNKLPDSQLQWTLEELFTRCNQFYLPKLNKELKLLREMGYADEAWLNQLETLLTDTYLKRFENNQAMLLRLGRHSGAEAVTLDGIRSIKIMKGNKGKDSWEAEARTIWLSASDEKSKQQMTPFGWVIIEHETPNWQLPEADQQWAQKIQQQQQQQRQAIKQKQAQVIAKQQQQLEQEKRQAEAAAQQQAALEAAKNAMSELAGEFYAEAQENNWETDKNAFLIAGKLENWIEKLQQNPDLELQQQIETLLEKHFKGIMANPEKTKGKKQKPVYSARMQGIVKQLITLKAEKS